MAQLPKKYRRGRRTLIRTDSAGGTHDFVAWLAQRGRWLSYSVGMVITEAIHQHVLKVPASAWTAAAEADGEIREGAWVAELTGDVLDGWPKGMRLIVRKERPHPGAQLRLTDADGMRLTCFATNTWGGRSPSSSSVTGCGPGPRTVSAPPGPPACGISPAPHDPEPDLAGDLADRAGPAGLDADAALTSKTRLWELRRLRLRPFTSAGQLVTTGHRRILRLARHRPWSNHINAALDRLNQLPDPG